MHVMVDLETMGNRPDAPIVAIGAVTFNRDGIQSEFYRSVDLNSAVVEGGGKMDPSTVIWWLGQSEGARNAAAAGGSHIAEALSDFDAWMPDAETLAGVWGNGAAFDNVILSESYKRLGMTPPWPFWLDRCYRTVKAMNDHVPFERVGTHHNALDDAKSQALHLIEIRRRLAK